MFWRKKKHQPDSKQAAEELAEELREAFPNAEVYTYNPREDIFSEFYQGDEDGN